MSKNEHPEEIPHRPVMPNHSLHEICTKEEAQEYKNTKDKNEYWRRRGYNVR